MQTTNASVENLVLDQLSILHGDSMHCSCSLFLFWGLDFLPCLPLLLQHLDLYWLRRLHGPAEEAAVHGIQLRVHPGGAVSAINLYFPTEYQLRCFPPKETLTLECAQKPIQKDFILTLTDKPAQLIWCYPSERKRWVDMVNSILSCEPERLLAYASCYTLNLVANATFLFFFFISCMPDQKLMVSRVAKSQ